MSGFGLGSKHSAASKAKMSAGRKGVQKSPAHRAKLAAHARRLAASRIGSTWTPEQKAALKIARAHIDHRVVSPAVRAIHSETSRRMWAEGRIRYTRPAQRYTTLARALHAHLSEKGLTLEVEVRFGRFTVDLYDREHHVAYEADGKYWHDLHEAKHPGASASRDEYLAAEHGLKVVHYLDSEIAALTGWPKRRAVA